MTAVLASFLQGRVSVVVADITKQDVDAIVNAANSSLLGGGGVDGAIHRAGGPAILDECRKIRRTLYPDGLPTGLAVITTAGKLAARKVIHTVGPIYGMQNGRDAELLTACYENCLTLAANHSLHTLAFPAISTGVFGYPRAEAASVSSLAVQNYLANNPSFKEVQLVFYNDEDARIFLENHQFQQ